MENKTIQNFLNVITKINSTLKLTTNTSNTKLLVVTKTRPINKILEIYNQGQRNFGENYINELIEKSKALPEDINWHFIGHLQSNKCKKILKIKNLSLIESVDSLNLAEELNKQCINLNRDYINVLLQVNISNEKTKSGINVNDVIQLYKDITTKCDRVKVKGLMSLGTIGSEEEFHKMFDFKNKISEDLILSFGTSDDYEKAIIAGSNEVRVGGLIFDV